MFNYCYLHTGRGLIFLLCAVFSVNLSLAQCDFQEVSREQNITHRFGDGLLGSGVSFMDFDGDGWDDLTFGTSEGEPLEIYRNNQGQFERVSLQGVNSTCESKQVTWVDYDNDGDKDLYISCNKDNLILYRNEGNLTFTDVTDGVNLQSPIGSALGANWADFDRDGWLDLYQTYYGGRNVLYRNIGGTSFQNITLESNAAPNIKPTFCGIVFDYDNDGWEDIYLANDRSTRNEMIKNLGDLSFEDVSAATRSDLPMDAMGTTLLDMNHDGYFEVYISNSPAGNALIFNNTDGTFTDIAEASGTLFESVGWGVNTLDFDNDSQWDLYVSSSEKSSGGPLASALYRATSTSEFERTQFEGMAADTMASFSNAVGDINNDGRIDIAVSNSSGTPSQLWQNRCTNDYHWIKVRPQGQISNRDGIGSVIIVYAAGQPLYQYMTAGTSFMGQNTDYLHFGLESRAAVDSVIVEWPSGLRDKVISPQVDALLTVVEGSTPRPVPVQGAEQAADLCEGETITLTVDVQAEGLQVQWSNGETGNAIEVSESGHYSVVVSGGGMSFESEIIPVEFNPIPDVTVSLTRVDSYTLGTITLVENNGPNTYRWEHDPTETGKSLTHLEPGLYRVFITNAAGCTIELIIELHPYVVTSLDDLLLAEIEYMIEAGKLHIQLPTDLAPRLREARLLNAMGQEVQRINPTRVSENLRFATMPIDQLVIVHLLFTDGKLVKKLVVRE